MDAGPGLSCNIRRPSVVSYTSAYTATPCADTSVPSLKPVGDATHPYSGLCYRLLPHQRDQAFVYLCLWQAQRLDDFCHYARERHSGGRLNKRAQRMGHTSLPLRIVHQVSENTFHHLSCDLSANQYRAFRDLTGTNRIGSSVLDG